MISAIILSGGKSSRMGQDKALLKLEGKTLLEIMISKLEPFTRDIIISSDYVDSYKFQPYPVVKDTIPNLGPLGGLHSCLKKSKHERNIVITCDLPLIPKELLEYLINIQSSTEIILPEENGRIQPLVGVYQKSVLDNIELAIKDFNSSGNKRLLSMRNLIKVSNIETFSVEKLNFYTEHIFTNMNTVEEFQKVKEIFSQLT